MSNVAPPRYIATMSTLSSSLISRLRRQLRVVALLFLGVMVLKSALAWTCAGDAFSELPTAASVAVESSAHSVDTDTPASADPTDSCWHSATAGCHCACVHVTPMPHDTVALSISPRAATRFPALSISVRLLPHDDNLRPPIA